MHDCGLDVSRKSTHIYIEDEQGRRVKRREWEARQKTRR
jgi:hypothetical protein